MKTPFLFFFIYYSNVSENDDDDADDGNDACLKLLYEGGQQHKNAHIRRDAMVGGNLWVVSPTPTMMTSFPPFLV